MAARLRVVAAYAVSNRNIEDLKLSVNGQRIEYRRTFKDGNTIYEADLDPQSVAARLCPDSRSPSTNSTPAWNSQLGIGIRRVEIVPIADPGI